MIHRNKGIMMTKEFTVEDLANEIEVLVTTGKYIEAFSLLMDEVNVTDTVQGEQNTVEFTWALGSKKFLSTVEDGEIVSMKVGSRFATFK